MYGCCSSLNLRNGERKQRKKRRQPSALITWQTENGCLKPPGDIVKNTRTELKRPALSTRRNAIWRQDISVWAGTDLPSCPWNSAAPMQRNSQQTGDVICIFQNIRRRTQNPSLSKDARKEHALCGLMSEVGEIAAIYQKAHQGHPVRTSEVALELGDLLWFVAEMCDVLGYDMETVAKWNIEKLRTRYPEGFDARRSLYREG